MGILQESAILMGHVRYPIALINNALNPFFLIEVTHREVKKVVLKEVYTDEYHSFNGIPTVPKTRTVEELRRVIVWAITKKP